MAKYNLSEVYPDYVFTRLGAGKNVDAVDYKKGAYVDLDGQTIGVVQLLLSRARDDNSVKFFQIEFEEE